MGFIKIGDDQPIKNIYNPSGEQKICTACSKPMTALAIKEDDSMELVCTCNNLDTMELN